VRSLVVAALGGNAAGRNRRELRSFTGNCQASLVSGTPIVLLAACDAVLLEYLHEGGGTVNQPANDEKLFTRIALLHEQAVASSNEQLAVDRATFRQRLEELTRRKAC